MPEDPSPLPLEPPTACMACLPTLICDQRQRGGSTHAAGQIVRGEPKHGTCRGYLRRLIVVVFPRAHIFVEVLDMALRRSDLPHKAVDRRGQALHRWGVSADDGDDGYDIAYAGSGLGLLPSASLSSSPLLIAAEPFPGNVAAWRKIIDAARHLLSCLGNTNVADVWSRACASGDIMVAKQPESTDMASTRAVLRRQHGTAPQTCNYPTHYTSSPLIP